MLHAAAELECMADMIAASQRDATQLERMLFQYDRHVVTCMLVRHYKA